MASESAVPPVNGGYGAPHHNAAELPAHNPPAGPNGAIMQAPAPPSSSATSGDVQEGGPSKDEVGWFFVEQYYTTLSKNPEKLPLFYNKKSQLVFGNEADKAPVSVGQRAIGERIKEIGVEDCKVRVTNVDSQESHDKSIVIQVIGEMSNKNEPHKKYVQTFVLAKQQNGYYVLNDIFRYIAEDEEEEELEQPEPEAVAVAVPEPELKTLPSTDDLAEQAKGVEVVDQKLERSAGSEPSALVADANGASTPEVEESAEASASGAAEEVEEEDDAQIIAPEDPKEPEPTPAPSTPQPQEPAPATKDASAAPKPSAPKTWASMFSGGNKVATPVVPAVPSSSAPAQPKKNAATAATAAAALTAAAAQLAPTQQVASATPPEDDPPLASPGGWQTAGQEHNRKQNRGQSNSVSANNNRDGFIKAYIKNVTEKVDGAVLRTTLAKYGKLEYFDISRQKNCAFVEFADQAGFNAAAAANPHSIGGEDVYVEERHIRAQNTYGSFNNRGSVRGRGGMDRNNSPGGGRGGYGKEGGRGNFQSRGGRGGGSISSRGRGMPQTA